MDTTLILAIALAGMAGGYFGWRLRGMRHLTERRVLEEIFTRKTRLAESEREVAVNTLDSAKLEGRTHLDRYQVAASQVESLERELGRAREAIDLGRESLSQTETRLAATLELSPAQCHVLHVIEPGRPMPMKQLAATLSCDASNVTGLVDRLESRGLVRRLPGRADRRVKELDLTPTGARLRAQLVERMTAPPASLGRLSARDQRTLARILSRLLG